MFTKNQRGEQILWCLLEGDAQEMAKQQLGRQLTQTELYAVQRGLEAGFEFWTEVMRTAIEEATKGGAIES